ADVARKQGLKIDVGRLSAELGMPVVETVAVQSQGHAALLNELAVQMPSLALQPVGHGVSSSQTLPGSAALQREVRRILALCAPQAGTLKRFDPRLDGIVMHPVWGLLLLGAILFLIFQAVFSWANPPMEFIKQGVAFLGERAQAHFPEGPLRSLLIDG